MVKFECPNCSYSFSEADKAWDKAVAYGGCPKCKKKHSTFNLNVQFNQKPQDEPLGIIGHLLAILVTLAISICVTLLLGFFTPLRKLNGGLMDGTVMFLLILVIIFIFAIFIAHLYTMKYFRQIKREGIF